MKNYILLTLLFILSSFTRPSTKFYLVSSPGIITGKYGQVEYICGNSSDSTMRSVYEVYLKPGSYRYYNFNKLDTIPFVIDNSGVYKLGFREDHQSLSIFANDPFEQASL